MRAASQPTMTPPSLNAAIKATVAYMKQMVLKVKPQGSQETEDSISVFEEFDPENEEWEEKADIIVALMYIKSPIFVTILSYTEDDEFEEVGRDNVELCKIDSKTRLFDNLSKKSQTVSIYPGDTSIHINLVIRDTDINYQRLPIEEKSEKAYKKKEFSLKDFDKVKVDVIATTQYLLESHVSNVGMSILSGASIIPNVNSSYKYSQVTPSMFNEQKTFSLEEMYQRMQAESSREVTELYQSAQEIQYESMMVKKNRPRVIDGFEYQTERFADMSMLMVNEIGDPEVVRGGWAGSQIFINSQNLTPQSHLYQMEIGGQAEEVQSRLFESCRSNAFDNFTRYREEIMELERGFDFLDTRPKIRDAKVTSISLNKPIGLDLKQAVREVLNNLEIPLN